MSKAPRRILIRVIVYGLLVGMVASGLMVGREVASDLNWHHLRFTEWIERDENKQWWYGFTVANRGWRCEELRISIREMNSDTSHQLRTISVRLAPEQSENVKMEPDDQLCALVYDKRGKDFLPVRTLNLKNAMKEPRLFQWKHYKDLEVFERPNILLPLPVKSGFPVEATTIMPKSGSSVDLTYYIWLPDEYFKYFGEGHSDSVTLTVDFYEYDIEILETGGARVLDTGWMYPTLFYTMYKGSVDVLKIRLPIPRRFIRTPERRLTYDFQIRSPGGEIHYIGGYVFLENPPRFPFVKRWIGKILTLIAPL